MVAVILVSFISTSTAIGLSCCLRISSVHGCLWLCGFLVQALDRPIISLCVPADLCYHTHTPQVSRSSFQKIGSYNLMRQLQQ